MIREDLVTLDDITGGAPRGTCASLRLLRLDKVHPVVSGNKWYKLKLGIAAAKEEGKKAVITFGGGYSNHLVAAAAAAREQGLAAIGFVRGIYEKGTPTLEQCRQYGMELRPLTRAAYDAAKADPHLFHGFPDAAIIPEGGANALGVLGAADIAKLIPADADTVILSVGTGTTMAGLCRGLPPKTEVVGCCAARDCDAALKLVAETAPAATGRWTIFPATSAFGKTSPELKGFIRRFYLETGVPLDVVYTGKMMMRVEQFLIEGRLAGRHVVCIHTGGLQGNPPDLFL